MKEVIGWEKIAPASHVLPFLKDLINLRVHAGEYQANKTSIIITDVNDLITGTIVDDVNEVVGFDDSEVESDLVISSGVQREYIHGVANAGDNTLVLLLDLRKVLTGEELELIKHQTIKNNPDSTNTDQTTAH